MQTPIIIYIACVNLLAFILCVYDKRAAIRKRCRIRERTLFIISLLGGATGMYIGMLAVRHKTRHWYFMLFIPIIIAAQVALLIYIFAL